jgi:putative sterol carrier protein
MPQVTNAREAFSRIEESFDASKAEGVAGSIRLELTGEGGGSWTIRIADADFELVEGSSESATSTLTMSAQDFVGLVNGEVNAMAAFMQGRIRLEGDLGLAMKFQTIFGIA